MQGRCLDSQASPQHLRCRGDWWAGFGGEMGPQVSTETTGRHGSRGTSRASALQPGPCVTREGRLGPLWLLQAQGLSISLWPQEPGSQDGSRAWHFLPAPRLLLPRWGTNPQWLWEIRAAHLADWVPCDFLYAQPAVGGLQDQAA